MISTADMRKGVVVDIDGHLFTVLDYQHIKVGRGSAQVRIKVRNVRSGATSEKTFQAGEKFPRVRLENRKVEYLYKEGNNYYMMDQETYDQFALTPEQLGDTVHYLKENGELDVQFYGEEPVGIGPIHVQSTAHAAELVPIEFTGVGGFDNLGQFTGQSANGSPLILAAKFSARKLQVDCYALSLVARS